MRIDLVTPTHIQIALSQRNLLALLAKLDGYPPDSACTITSSGEDGPTLVVHAEDDEEHYGDRPEPPGPMVPDTEARIRRGPPTWRWRGGQSK